jgi:cyclophilin family peptidyl-prolyl cis-trans isomerase
VLPLETLTRNLLVVVEMENGRVFRMAFYADQAPLAKARFVRLVAAQYYDGLTFHRVVPNFVIQGGGPNANEYCGDCPFMRDEVGLRMHLRGTVGVSTRGRDTGDAQIFVNLVDNARLDHDYTVFAYVCQADLPVVDGIHEGDRMRRVRIGPGSALACPPPQ